MTVALFLLLHCQVNVYIIAKPDLTQHSITFEVSIVCGICACCTFFLLLCLLVALYFIAHNTNKNKHS